MSGPSKVAMLTLALVAGLLALPDALGARPEPVAAEAKSFTLGRLQLFALRDADNVVDNDARTFGVGHSPAEVAAVLRRAGAPDTRIRLSVDALLVKAPGRLMLFDTGLGPRAHGVLVASLAKAGVQPAEVTDIFITHSHGDHVGGLIAPDGNAAFPHAIVHMSGREWDWMKTQPQNAALVQAIAAQVKPFEPGAEIAPGVRAVALYGHTPGHVGYQIISGGARLLDMGDVAHSFIVSLAEPGWTVEYDTDAEHGRRTREATLAELAHDGELVFGPHMPFPGIGHVVPQGAGYAWKPAIP